MQTKEKFKSLLINIKRCIQDGFSNFNFKHHKSYSAIFVLGILAVIIKSDLQIPESSSKFISLYLLFAIGFKGGQELAHSQYSSEITYTLLFGVFMAVVVPAYTFLSLKENLAPVIQGL